MAMLRSLPGVDVREIDLATLSLRQQLETISSTDILVGEPCPCRSSFPTVQPSLIRPVRDHLQHCTFFGATASCSSILWPLVSSSSCTILGEHLFRPACKGM